LRNFAESFGVFKWFADFELSDSAHALYTHIAGGEWKGIRSPETGLIVYNFDLVESKPDLILLYNGNGEETLTKHAEIIVHLAQELSTERDGWSSEDAQCQVIPTLLWCVEGGQGRTEVEVQALVREFRQELVAAGYTGPNITVCLEAVYNEDTGVISTNHSVVGDDSRAIQALTELISGVREA
jgi:hypothetical protein